jgi:hypothetical protein
MLIVFLDAKGDVLRGLQVAEAACGIPEQMKGEVLEVAKDMETRNYREPLGVVAAICPFSKWLRLSQTALLTITSRLSRYDSSLVDSNCDSHRKLPHSQAL